MSDMENILKLCLFLKSWLEPQRRLNWVNQSLWTLVGRDKNFHKRMGNFVIAVVIFYLY